jgi:hypothetical protein
MKFNFLQIYAGVATLAAAAAIWSASGASAGGEAARRRAAEAEDRAQRAAADNTRLKSLVANLSSSLSSTNAQYREWLRQRGRPGQKSARQAAAGTDLVPRNAWANRGFDSPEHAFETVLWSMRQGDAIQLLNCFSPEFRQQTESQMSPDDLKRMAGEAANIEAVPISQIGSIFKAPILRSDGKVDPTAANYMVFRKIGSEWKLDAQWVPGAGDATYFVPFFDGMGTDAPDAAGP